MQTAIHNLEVIDMFVKTIANDQLYSSLSKAQNKHIHCKRGHYILYCTSTSDQGQDLD